MKKVAKKITKAKAKSPVALVLISALIILGSIAYLTSQFIPGKYPDINETTVAKADPAEEIVYQWSFDDAADFSAKGWELYGYAAKTNSLQVVRKDGDIVIPGTINKGVSLLVNDLATSEKLKKANMVGYNLAVDIGMKYMTPADTTPSTKTPTAKGVQALNVRNPKHFGQLGISNANVFISNVSRENKNGNAVERKVWSWKPLASKKMMMYLASNTPSTTRFLFTEQDLAKVDNIASMQLILNPDNDPQFTNVAITHIIIKKISTAAPVPFTTILGKLTKSETNGQVSYLLLLDTGRTYELRNKIVIQDPEKLKYAGVTLDPLEANVDKHVEVQGILTTPDDAANTNPAVHPIFTVETIVAK